MSFFNHLKKQTAASNCVINSSIFSAVGQTGASLLLIFTAFMQGMSRCTCLFLMIIT